MDERKPFKVCFPKKERIMFYSDHKRVNGVIFSHGHARKMMRSNMWILGFTPNS